MEKVSFNLNSYLGFTVVLEDGTEVLLKDKQEIDVHIEYAARNSHEEFVSDFVIIHKELEIDGKRFANSNVFTATEFLPLMTQQTCQVDFPISHNADRFKIESLEGIGLSAESREVYWIPIDFKDDKGWPEFYSARLKYFGCKFSIILAIVERDKRICSRVFGKFSDGVLVGKYAKKEYSGDVYFTIPNNFLLFTNTARPRPRDENGNLPTYESYNVPPGADPIIVSESPWAEADFGVPMVWRPVVEGNESQPDRIGNAYL